ncbi:hypothetical protein POX_a00423 [Penicillium oxalicum]|nr:hypothetical protein POX_a00423 [Penicillium oxalicum]KAI2793836.1 hypothetical protein POX_a00423 [Penicillium oxalicum]
MLVPSYEIRLALFRSSSLNSTSTEVESSALGGRDRV